MKNYHESFPLVLVFNIAFTFNLFRGKHFIKAIFMVILLIIAGTDYIKYLSRKYFLRRPAS